MMRLILIALAIFMTAPLFASAGSGHDGLGSSALFLALILVAAKLGADLAERVGQPAVLGELLGGVLLGNLGLLGFGALEPIKTDGIIDLLAQLGLLILLFEAGLETTVPEMRKVGLRATAVALVGMIVPFVLGYFVAAWLLPESSVYVHAFLGAALCATSIGITARVLKDLDQSQSPTAKLILGAAALDDLLVLVVLAVMKGMIEASEAQGAFPWPEVGSILTKSVLFLGLAMALGVYLSLKIFKLASMLRGRGALLAAGMAFCFSMAWAAGAIGLAPLIGAFAAGVILEDLHSKDFVKRGEDALDTLVQPISSFLVPVFFVLMGMRTDLRALAQAGTIPLAIGLTLAAIVGKLACSLVVSGKGLNRLAVGIGMIPRGEVGLVFASMGLTLTLGGLPLLNQTAYSAIVIMVIFSTIVTPPALKWSLQRRSKLE